MRGAAERGVRADTSLSKEFNVSMSTVCLQACFSIFGLFVSLMIIFTFLP